MPERVQNLVRVFEAQFGNTAQHIARAPGRVNLIGEHTDYNDGFVLPCAIGYDTLVAITPRDDNDINVLALDCDAQTDSFNLGENIPFHDKQMWCNYIRGVCHEMLLRGHTLRGCDIAITGNVPQGAGLSSSASLEIAVIKALSVAANIDINGTDMALIGQAAENNFVGCACGIMDQLISAQGRSGKAIAIDCRSLELTPLAVPKALSLLIVNSNVKRGLVDSEYNTRRQQCEAAAAHFGLSSLRDLDLETFQQQAHRLDADVAKRARHVLEENQRVLDTKQAFRDDDLPRISRLMAASHRSMRDLFDITTPEIDTLVEIIDGAIGHRGGVRMTGGGFGGCVVALLEHDLVERTCDVIQNVYPLRSGIEATSYLTAPADGASLLK